ncbi:MAG TPA: ribonuclease PH [Actinomycetota bacterium]|nr:ribonuclease PH [Actinomycetota bacterium]
MSRIDGRGPADLRPVLYETGYLEWAEGSVLLEMGNTKVLCAASYEPGVPPFLQGKGTGWVTAEYSMLPRSTQVRTPREASRGRQSGRTLEIQRLVGRSLRAVTRLDQLPEATFWVDCDVLQADGGTRTASITGGYIALALAVRTMKERGVVDAGALADSVAAVSAGIVDGQGVLDLTYEEDARAEVDFNVVMTGSGKLVEVQGTAEGEPFSREDLDAMLSQAATGIDRLTAVQREASGA